MEQKYIGTMVDGNKVVFEVNGNIYVKNIKEKNKVRRQKYIPLESVNIICEDLSNDYVFVESDNRGYFNKTLLILIVLGIFLSMISVAVTSMISEKFFGFSILACITFFTLLIFYLFYVILKQPKKLYKNYTEIVEGEIIDYRRIEHSKDNDSSKYCDYNIMYKYRTPNGKFIRSVVNRQSAKFLYKDYPLNSKVLIRYNPLKCCESCLVDEFDSIYGNKKFGQNYSVLQMAIARVTNISTVCIDEPIEEYLKQYTLVDYIECEYTIAGVSYKATSVCGVPHGKFKIGENMRIFYEQNNKNNFFCDLAIKR